MENKDYYEWLEISKNASQEVIEKAYKTLVKKYHPDLQEDDNKIKAEETIKKINEAYAVLSDETKRKQYDETIKENTISKEEYDKLKQELNNVRRQANPYNENQNIQYTYHDINNQQSSTNHNMTSQTQQNVQQNNQEAEYKQKIESAVRKAYRDAYVQELKNRGYKIRYKKTMKDYFTIFIVVIAIILVCALLWLIPFTREKIIDIYNSNSILKGIVDIIINIFQ